MTGGGTVVVGAGHAAGELAHRLRAQGYSQPVTLKPLAPYLRPPLSKTSAIVPHAGNSNF